MSLTRDDLYSAAAEVPPESYADAAVVLRAMARMSPDERAVMRWLAERVDTVGARGYGRLDLANDTRDMRAEAAAEAVDGLFYLAAAGVKRERA